MLSPDREPHPALSRRQALGALGLAGLGLAGLAGCGEAASTGAASPGTRTDDEGLVASVGTAIATTHALVAATGRRHPDLRSVAEPLAALHTAHLSRLDATDDVARPRVLRDATGARERLISAEQALATTLVDAAMDAASGSLAQVFASMAAAIDQQLVAL